MKRESSVEIILKDFGDFPKDLKEEVMQLASILSGCKTSLYVHNTTWSEAKRQRFIRKVWNSRDAYRRDVLNQPFDGVTWPLEQSQGYGEEYTVALLDHIRDTNRCQPQKFDGYGNNSKNLQSGSKVCLAIVDQWFEGQVGVVIADSHGKWMVAFPHEDGVVHGRFYPDELLNLGDYHAKVQDSQNLGQGSSRS